MSSSPDREERVIGALERTVPPLSSCRLRRRSDRPCVFSVPELPPVSRRLGLCSPSTHWGNRRPDPVPDFCRLQSEIPYRLALSVAQSWFSSSSVDQFRQSSSYSLQLKHKESQLF